MKIRDARRDAAIDRMADHLLDAGLANASLRALAAAAKTSDRMLLYYFTDKDALLQATLERIAARLTAMLDAALPPGARLDFKTLLGALWTSVGAAPLRPYMRVWLELAAGAARGRAPDTALASGIMAGFVAWTEAHLEPDPGGDGGSQAALLLAIVEGGLFLDAVGHRAVAEAAVAAALAALSTLLAVRRGHTSDR